MAQLQQYESLIEAVKTKAFEQDCKEFNALYQRISILRIVMIALVVIAVGLAVAKQNTISCIVLVLAVVVYILHSNQSRQMTVGFRKTMLDACDPEGVVDRFVILCEHSTPRTWSQNYHNVGNALFYAGRFSEARAVAYVIKNNAQNNIDFFYAEMLGCRLCSQAGDVEGLEQHIAKMKTFAKDVKSNSPELRFFYAEAMALPHYAYLEADHAYQTFYNELIEEDKGSTMLRKVEKAYRLRTLAGKLGKPDKEREYREFVLENGGTTFFRKEFLSDDASVVEALNAAADAVEPVAELEDVVAAEPEAVAEAAEAAAAEPAEPSEPAEPEVEAAAVELAEDAEDSEEA